MLKSLSGILKNIISMLENLISINIANYSIVSETENT